MNETGRAVTMEDAFSPMTPAELRAVLDQVPRIRAISLPTPLEEAPRLSKHLGGPRIFIKRDDLTGIGLGGNKLRSLEFRLAVAAASGADVVILGVEILSNSARQTTGFANRLGMSTVLVLKGAPPESTQGNLLLDYLLGADVRFVSEDEELEEEMRRVAEELTRQGRRPHILNADPIFSIASVFAYATTYLEIQDQMQGMGLHADYLYICSSGKGQAGLVLAQRATHSDCTIRGIAVVSGYDVAARAASQLNEAAGKLGLRGRVQSEDIENDSGYMGEAYGVPTPECLEAFELFARLEGVILDPVYTAKAAAGMIDHIRTGRVRKDAVVVFIHTGGTPSVFTFSRELLARTSAAGHGEPRIRR